MNYKLLLYVFNIMLCIFAFSAIDFNRFIKTNKIIETRVLALIISFISAYLLTNFIYDILSVSLIF